jgi:hypothetical protein
MAFMTPQYTQEAFVQGENRTTFECRCLPAEYESILTDEGMEISERYDASKWWACLSAPGYMDRTDWDGPFDSEEEAREHIRETYDVDPDTGDDLLDD